MVFISVLLFLSTVLMAQPQADSIADSLQPVQEWGNIEVEGALSTDSLTQNDTLTFTMKLQLKGNPDDYAIAEPGIPPISNLNLIATSQTNRTERTGDETTLIKEYKFVFTPVSIGMAYINPLRIQYVFVPNGENRSLASSRLEIEVTEPIIPKKGVDWIVIIIVLIIVATGAIIAYVLAKKNQTPEVVETEPDPPEKVARHRLANLKGDRDSDIINYIDDVTRILYNYVYDRYTIDASRLSQNEIISALENKGIPPTTAKHIDNALDICDHVRFAGHKATSLDRDSIELALESLLNYGEKSFLGKERADTTDSKE